MRENHGRKRMLTTIGLAAVLIAAAVTATAYGFIRHARSYGRPSGIPASITDSQEDPAGRIRVVRFSTCLGQ